MIKEVKSTMPLETLCKGIPKEFVTFLKYVKELGFTETPNYKYLKRLFRKLFVISGYDFDYRYDWVEDKYKKKSKKHSKFEDKKKELKAMAKQLTKNMNKISKVSDFLWEFADFVVETRKEEEIEGKAGL